MREGKDRRKEKTVSDGKEERQKTWREREREKQM